MIGAPAPAIEVGSWLTGPPPSLAFEPGHITVIAVVTSSCPSSRAAVRYLNTLHRMYAGREVTIVAVTDEPVEDARSILEARSVGGEDEVPEYPVGAALDPAGHAQYLDVVRAERVPKAFLVGRNGQLEWFGDPDILEEPLRRVVEGEWDRDAFADRLARLTPLDARVIAVLERFKVDKPAAVQAYRNLVDEHAGRAEELNEIAWVLIEAAEGAPIQLNPSLGDLLAIAHAAVQESLRIAPDDGNTLDTLAHLQVLHGDAAAALETQRRAAANPGLFGPRIRHYLHELEAAVANRIPGGGG